MKICTKCNKDLSLENFDFRDKTKNTRRADCKKCHGKLKTKHYVENKDNYRLSQQKSRERNRQFLKDYLSDKSCTDCGIRDWRVLEFDHLEDKVGDVSHLAFVRKFSIVKLLDEIAKCEIRCANCHRLVSYKRQGSYKQ